jgi:hypothetical protein
MQFTIEKTETKKVDVEINLPAYYKWNHFYIKILSLGTSIQVRDAEYFFGIAVEMYQEGSHAMFVDEGQQVTEEEFLEAFHRVGEKVKRELIKAIETDGWKAQEREDFAKEAASTTVNI